MSQTVKNADGADVPLRSQQLVYLMGADGNPIDLGRTVPKSKHRTLTPDNNTDLDPVPAVLYVTVTGDVEIIDSDGTAVTYSAVPVGLFPFSAKRLGEATTATVVAWND